MKCNDSSDKTDLLTPYLLKKAIIALTLCSLPIMSHAVDSLPLNVDLSDEIYTEGKLSALIGSSNIDSSSLSYDVSFEDMPFEDAPFDDDIDAVVDEDAINDATDMQEGIDNTDIGSIISSDVNNDDIDNIDAIPRDLGEQTEGDDTDYEVIEDFEVTDDSLDLTFEHVPLNAISPNTIQTFVEVIEKVRQDYVRPVNDEVLFQHAIAGMLEKLDSHAEYLTPKNYEKLRNFTDGEIGQVGLSAVYSVQSAAWIIDKVVPNSPASEAGIEVGDKLISIKNVKLKPDMQPQDIDQLLSGIAGTQVQVTITTPGYAERYVTLQRNLSKNNKLDIRVQEDIAVIRLPIFQNTTKNQLLDTLRDLDVPISGVVLDVRNNPGGVLSSAIDVASLFIKDSGLIQVRNRTNSSQTINPNGTPYLADLPVVILQNRYSASAAEVLASSLKSNNRAKVVGEVSFGKGTVQEVIPLENGGAIKLTVAEYRDINGEPIDGVGIKPDILFLHDGSDWQQQAITLLVSQDRPVDVQIDDIDEDVPAVIDY